MVEVLGAVQPTLLCEVQAKERPRLATTTNKMGGGGGRENRMLEQSFEIPKREPGV